MGSGIAAALLQGAAETVWGRRGIVKTSSLLLPLSLLLYSRTEGLPAVSDCFSLAGSAACWAIGSILANDIADSAEDRSAGKHRWITELPAPAALSVVSAAWVLGALLAVWPGRIAALAAYGGAVVLSLCYSTGPLELKRRGVWGLPAYSGACALAYAALPWMSLGGSLAMPAVLVPAVFLDKWVNLHFHQVIDLESDMAARVSTYAAEVGRERARRGLAAAALLASAALCAAFACAVLVAPSPERWLVAAAGIGATIAAGFFARARGAEGESPLVRELPWHYLALTYGVLRITPAVMLFCLSYQHQRFAPLAVIALMLVAWETVLSFLYRRP